MSENLPTPNNELSSKDRPEENRVKTVEKKVVKDKAKNSLEADDERHQLEVSNPVAKVQSCLELVNDLHNARATNRNLLQEQQVFHFMLNNQRSEFQSKILTLEEENEKISKVSNKHKKMHDKAMTELNKLKDRIRSLER